MDTIRFRDTDGKMRSGQVCVCIICGLSYTTRLSRVAKQKCCSTKCSRQLRHINYTTEVECSSCKTKFRKRNGSLANSKSGLYFCNHLCKEAAQKLGGISEIQPNHYGTRTSSFGIKDCEYLNLEQKCVDCGESRRYLLSLHHIDSDRDNNKPNNLEVVCGNCHIRRHLYFVDEQWVFNYKKLTPRDKISEL